MFIETVRNILNNLTHQISHHYIFKTLIMEEIEKTKNEQDLNSCLLELCYIFYRSIEPNMCSFHIEVMVHFVLSQELFNSFNLLTIK
jgi:hypothetical protein